MRGNCHSSSRGAHRVQMDISSIQDFCQYLISSAIQRCRRSDQPCRLTVVFKSLPNSNYPLICISVSDTGVRSCLEDYHQLKFAADCITSGKWNGIVSVTTTDISSDEIYHYELNFIEADFSKRLIHRPSSHKNGARFSGTEVMLYVSDCSDEIISDMTCFFHKIQIVRPLNILLDARVEDGDMQPKHLILLDHCLPPPPSSNAEGLASGLKDYVYKHRNNLDHGCSSCFPSLGNLKVGTGTTYSEGSGKNVDIMMETAIVVSGFENSSPCLGAYAAQSELLYFKEFSPSTLTDGLINALMSISWKHNGLTLRSISKQNGCVLLVWDGLPSCTSVSIALHCYQKNKAGVAAAKDRIVRSLIRKSVKLALDDLKQKNPGVLCSAQALKVRGYAPVLAKTICGLIISSNDLSFKQECCSLLGLNNGDITPEIIGHCINDKILFALDRSQRGVAPFLFDEQYTRDGEKDEGMRTDDEA